MARTVKPITHAEWAGYATGGAALSGVGMYPAPTPVLSKGPRTILLRPVWWFGPEPVSTGMAAATLAMTVGIVFTLLMGALMVLAIGSALGTALGI